MLKYKGFAVVFQEVPDEISLAINICGCTHRCPDCHSQFLWDDDGQPLMADFHDLLNRYRPYISCICFMGGDQNQSELEMLCKIAHADGFKTCLYTAYFMSDLIKPLLNELDYVKVGRFIKEKGPLTNPNTNQKMYRKSTSGNVDTWLDITDRFWAKYAEKEKRK